MNSSKRTIAYVGPMSFPVGGAGTRRILGNALSFISAGYDVVIGSGQLPQSQSSYDEEFKEIAIYSVGERIAEDKPVLIKHLIYSRMGKKTVAWLNTLNPLPEAIILYGGDMPYLLNLMPWCKKHNIPLVFEAVEWYDPTNMPGGRFSPYRINFEITMRYLVPRVKNVIAISSYLADHFKEKGCETVCIPPTIDTHQFRNTLPERTDGQITIGYTGTPGNKDLFNNYLEAFLQTDFSCKRFIFNVAGLTSSEILKYPAMRSRKITRLPLSINCQGKVSHAEAVNLIAESDFSILLRYPRRYAKAGFPTKVVESMAMGTPVICNLTSDLHKYVHDGTSGIVCKDHHVDSLISALLRVEKMSSTDIIQMRHKAREIAEASFDYRNYVSVIDDFMQRVRTL